MPPPELFRCAKCGKKLSAGDKSLTRHDCGKIYSCTCCGFKTRRKLRYKRHVFANHSNVGMSRKKNNKSTKIGINK